GRHRPRTDERIQAQRLRGVAGSGPAVRRGRREGRAELGRGGAARRVASPSDGKRYRPPETVTTLPVTNFAAGEMSQATASAISSGTPTRRNGVMDSIRSRAAA